MEGKESGFRSLESIWTEDGGSGGHGRGGTGRLEAYRTRVGGRNLFPKTKSEGKGSKIVVCLISLRSNDYC